MLTLQANSHSTLPPDLSLSFSSRLSPFLLYSFLFVSFSYILHIHCSYSFPPSATQSLFPLCREWLLWYSKWHLQVYVCVKYFASVLLCCVILSLCVFVMACSVVIKNYATL